MRGERGLPFWPKLKGTRVEGFGNLWTKLERREKSVIGGTQAIIQFGLTGHFGGPRWSHQGWVIGSILAVQIRV